MILVRNVFRLKFGKAKDAVAVWNQGKDVLGKLNYSTTPVRITTDLVGPKYYTLVMESTHNSVGDYEANSSNIMSNNDWQQWYAKFVPLVKSGHREIYNIVE